MVVDNAQLYKLRQGSEKEWQRGETSNLDNCTVCRKEDAWNLNPPLKMVVMFHFNSGTKW